MTWLASIGVAILTGVATMLLAGVLASLAVDWYRVSGMEGASGYFVAGLAIVGLVGGFLIGLIASRIVAAGADPGFVRALLVSLSVSLGLTGAIGGVARLLADVPPRIDGEMLVVAIEVRYPASRKTSPAGDTAAGKLTLHSIPAFSHTVRISENGPYWKEDARESDGHWIVPGAVTLFTERGKRMLEVNPDDATHFGFLVPIARRPGNATLDWSEWMPRARPGSPPLPDQMSIRFRIRRQSDVIRTEKAGGFEVGTMPGYYYDTQADGKFVIASNGSFAIGWNGTPVPVVDGARLGGVAATGHGLVVLAQPADSESSCFYLTATATGPRSDSLGSCGTYTIEAVALTNDTTRFKAGRRQDRIPGRIDRLTFAESGPFLLGKTLLDTRTGEIHRFTSDTIYLPVPSVPPLGLSPDGRSLVRYGFDQANTERLVLAVTDVVADRSYLLPVDPRRMRFPTLDDLDPAWLQHHFEWRRGAEGHDVLAERAHFVPIPYHGVVSDLGGERVYRIEKAGRELREALIAFLVAEYQATRMPADSDAYQIPVSIGGKQVDVAASSDFSYVMISMPEKDRDPTLIGAIGARFNTALASGKYDTMFGP